MFQFSFKDIETYYRLSVVWQEGKKAIPPTFEYIPFAFSAQTLLKTIQEGQC